MYEKEKTDYDENGYCIIKNYFNADELLVIENDLSKYIENEVPKLEGRDVNYIDGVLNSVHDLCKTDNGLSKLAKRNDIVKLAEIFLDAKPELRVMELFAKPPRKGLQSPIHQDNFYWCVDGSNALTFWIALDESSSSNGGLEYYPKTHKLGLVDHVNSYAPGSSQMVEKKYLENMKAIIPHIYPGDILVHHSLTFHGSADNKSDKSRRGLTMQFKDASAPYDEKMLNHYLSNLELQVSMRNNK